MRPILPQFKSKATNLSCSGLFKAQAFKPAAIARQQPTTAQLPLIKACRHQLPVPPRRVVLLGAAFGASLLPAVLLCASFGSRGLGSSDLLPMVSNNQEQLTRKLRADGLIRTPRVASAFAKVDRFTYCFETEAKIVAYVDSPQPIGYGQTISAPHMHATCLELLESRLQPGAQILDVGSGSGFMTAAMALLVAPEGRVFGVEKVAALAHRSIESLKADQPQLMSQGVITITAGNALGDILSGDQQFDAIHVGAAAASMPEILKEKLANGGRMVIPVDIPGGSMQILQQVDKSGDGTSYETTDLMGVGYVPLLPPQ